MNDRLSWCEIVALHKLTPMMQQPHRVPNFITSEDFSRLSKGEKEVLCGARRLIKRGLLVVNESGCMRGWMLDLAFALQHQDGIKKLITWEN